MQGEHIIACGKISGGEGNESGRRIDVETRGREEATWSEWEKVWEMRAEMNRWEREHERRAGWSDPLRANDIKEVWWIDTRWVLLTSPEPGQAKPAFQLGYWLPLPLN